MTTTSKNNQHQVICIFPPILPLPTDSSSGKSPPLPSPYNTSGTAGSAPIRLRGKKVQTVPTTDRQQESTMTVKAKTVSRVESSWPKSLR